jgi:hypothetical protein
MYKKTQTFNLDFNLVEGNAVVRLSDNATIPFDPANTDYQEYLTWLAEGNEPEPADEASDEPSTV